MNSKLTSLSLIQSRIIYYKIKIVFIYILLTFKKILIKKKFCIRKKSIMKVSLIFFLSKYIYSFLNFI